MAKSRGFTLIEVVVALAILGIGLAVVLQLFSGGLRLGRISQEYTKAVGYGRIKMEEMAGKDRLEEGEEKGDFDSSYRWQVAVKKVDILPPEKPVDFRPPVELFHIEVDITWKSGWRERTARFESYRTVRTEEDGGRS